MTRAIYKSDLIGLLDGVPVQNSLIWLSPNSNATFAEADAINDEIAASGLGDLYLACLSEQYLFEGVATRGIQVPDDSLMATPPAILNGGEAPGTRTGSLLTNAAGPLLEWAPTLTAGLRVRWNKMFLPGINEADAGQDLLGGPIVTAIEAFATALLAGLSVSGLTIEWVTLIKVGGIKTCVPITGHAINPKIKIQKNRRPGGIFSN